MDNEGFVEHELTFLNGSVGDMQTEYWTSEDWKNHRERVDELKKSGGYLKPFKIKMTMKHCPSFEEDHVPNIESYRFKILDLDK